MINIGIIGYGYWGANLVRNFYSLDNCRLRAVADNRPERISLLRKNFPAVTCYEKAEEIINNMDIDAVVIATPVSAHFGLAWKALNKGKHVLIEKPMTGSVREAELLIKLASEKNLLLMVDHTFLYTGAVEKMKQIIESGSLGKLSYFDSTRINLGLFQHDINVLWDLAPHDISILSYIIKELPYSVNATGITHTGNHIENMAYLTINYESNFIAHFNCSWSSPVKLRTILIGGDAKMILYNDLEPTEKLKIYDTGYSHRTDEEKKRVLVDYRTGDIYVPKLNTCEALTGMANDFVSSIQHNKQPISCAELGLNVVKVLEASNLSIKNKGREIKLKESGKYINQFRNAELEQN